MVTVTTHEAKTHLSRLLDQVIKGEHVVIRRGKQPIARLVKMDAEVPTERPKVGKPSSEPVHYEADLFRPLTDKELEEWGL